MEADSRRLAQGILRQLEATARNSHGNDKDLQAAAAELRQLLASLSTVPGIRSLIGLAPRVPPPGVVALLRSAARGLALLRRGDCVAALDAATLQRLIFSSLHLAPEEPGGLALALGAQVALLQLLEDSLLVSPAEWAPWQVKPGRPQLAAVQLILTVMQTAADVCCCAEPPPAAAAGAATGAAEQAALDAELYAGVALAAALLGGECQDAVPRLIDRGWLGFEQLHAASAAALEVSLHYSGAGVSSPSQRALWQPPAAAAQAGCLSVMNYVTSLYKAVRFSAGEAERATLLPPALIAVLDLHCLQAAALAASLLHSLADSAAPATAAGGTTDAAAAADGSAQPAPQQQQQELLAVLPLACRLAVGAATARGPPPQPGAPAPFAHALLPDAEAAEAGLELAEQLVRLAGKHRALVQLATQAGAGPEEMGPLTGGASVEALLLAAAGLLRELWLGGDRLLAGPGADPKRQLAGAKSLVMSAVKLSRLAGAGQLEGARAAPGAPGPPLGRLVGQALELATFVGCQVLVAHPEILANAGASSAERIRESGFVTFGALPALLDGVLKPRLLSQHSGGFVAHIVLPLAQAGLLEDAAHGGLGALLNEYFRVLVEHNAIPPAKDLVGACTLLLHNSAKNGAADGSGSGSGAFAAVLVKDQLVSSTVMWASHLAQTPGAPEHALALTYVPPLLRAACDAVDAAAPGSRLAIEFADLFKNIPAEYSPERWSIPANGAAAQQQQQQQQQPDARPAAPWLEQYRRYSTWAAVQQRLLPRLLRAAVEAGKGAKLGDAEGEGVLRDRALAGTPSCGNSACLNLRAHREAELPTSRCSACSVVLFCSKQCQVTAWKQHKSACKAMAASKASDGA